VADRDDDVPLPYGLPEEPRERQYLDIVAPNLDKISRDVLDPTTFEGQRGRRGAAILGWTVGAAVAIVLIGMAIEWLGGFFDGV
jgi:hypothetical protein